MISRIRGKIRQQNKDSILLEVQGICYEVICPPFVIGRLSGIKDVEGFVEFTTYHYHQVEPSRSTPVLIGFLNEIEKEFFEKFITVSGFGPKTAVKSLVHPIPDIATAIDRGDLLFLRSLPGVGPQRSKDIIAKLQGKVGKYGLIQTVPLEKQSDVQKNILEEAVQILVQLQYTKKEADDMVRRAFSKNPRLQTAEDIFNEVFRERVVKK
ncbi:hypothetical protein B9J78_05570 [bacterium Unc6]|nr:hypothetical protein [bacterium Unc6]